MKYEDEDGIDGPFDRAMAREMKRDAAKAAVRAADLQICKADADGECNHKGCPQVRDGEPEKSGRSCPLPWHRWISGAC